MSNLRRSRACVAIYTVLLTMSFVVLVPSSIMTWLLTSYTATGVCSFKIGATSGNAEKYISTIVDKDVVCVGTLTKLPYEIAFDAPHLCKYIKGIDNENCSGFPLDDYKLFERALGCLVGISMVSSLLFTWLSYGKIKQKKL